MKLRAIHGFKRRDTGVFIKNGHEFTAPESYGVQLTRGGLAEQLDGKAAKVETKALVAAPQNKAAAKAPETKRTPVRAVGVARSSASPAAPRSRKATAKVSVLGAKAPAKRATVTRKRATS